VKIPSPPSRTILGIVLLLLALPVGAQEPPPEPARFLLEKITVLGPKAAAANIVRSETLLREGQSYTEDELRQAVARIHRLPFVLDASFALQKGSQRGAFELVIETHPARWFFFDHWARAYRLDEPLAINPEGSETFSSRESSTFSLGGLIGARKFVGNSGVVFAALDSEETLQVGFTQYDLFHRGVVASAGYSRGLCCETEVLPIGLDPTFAGWSFDDSQRFSLNLTVPLGGRQSIQVAVSDRAGEAGVRREVLASPADRFRDSNLVNGDLSYRRAEAKWVYNTSDDPVLPTRGVTLSAGLEASRFSGRDLERFRFSPDLFEFVPAPPFDSEQVVAAFSGVRHWSITPRQTVSGHGRLSVGRSRVENLLLEDRFVPSLTLNSYGGSAGVLHSLTLRRARGRGNFTDLRLESGAEYGMERTWPDVGPSPLERFSASVGLVFRNQWGRVRASLTYLDLGKVFR